MRKATSFFYSREHDPGKTYELSVDLRDRRIRLEIYSAAPFEATVLSDQKFNTDEQYRLFRDDLRDAVLRRGRGGLVVRTEAIGRVMNAFVDSVSDPLSHQDYHPPGKLLHLRAGYPPAWIGFDTDGMALSPDEHVVIPVHEEARERLVGLLNGLAWFSTDLEAVVLNAIRRPSIDVRLERLERQVLPEESAPKQSPAAQPQVMPDEASGENPSVPGLSLKPVGTEDEPQRAGDGSEKSGGVGAILSAIKQAGKDFWASEYSKTALTAVLVIALLITGWMILKGDATSDAPLNPTAQSGPAVEEGALGAGELPADAPPATEPPAPEPESPATEPQPAAVQVSSLLNSFERFFQAFEEGARHNDKLAILFNSHFGLYKNSPWNPRTMTAALKEKDFLWGIVKLQVLKLRPNPQDIDFLRDTRAVTPTKEIFRSIERASIEIDEDARKMLAVLACNMKYRTPGGPGLPLTEDNASYRFMEGTCEQRHRREMIPGLENLTGFIKSYAPE